MLSERALYVKERRRRRSEEVGEINNSIMVLPETTFYPIQYLILTLIKNISDQDLNQGVEFNNQYNQARLKSQAKKDPLVSRYVRLGKRFKHVHKVLVFDSS